MKKTILSIATVVAMSLSAFAQIPNNSFENWTSMGSYNNPDNWDNLNGMTSTMSVYTCVKGSGGATGGGSSYIKLVSKTVSGMGVMPGLAVSGTINMMNYSAQSGFAYTGQPQSLDGSWQYMGYSGDKGFIAVYLTRWNSGTMMRDTVASAINGLNGMVMSWATFSIPLTYMSSAIPDSAMIILSSSGSTPVANSYLYVDNLSFTGSVAGVKEGKSAIDLVSIYPNPAKEKINLNIDLPKETELQIQLVDITGKLIREIKSVEASGKYNTTINVSDLSKGVYFLKINAGETIKTEKIVIE